MSVNLDQIADHAGRFAILAMDQRGTLRTMLEKAGQPTADQDLSDFKVDVIGALSPLASGVLTDVEHGVGPVRAAAALDPRAGLLIASERSPQPTWNGEQRTEYAAAERGPVFVAENGGAALKFLVRWRPDRPARPGEPDLAQEALDAVAAVVADCRAYGMPSVIEPLVTRLPGDEPFSAERRNRMVIRSAELLAALGPDLLKLEWPGDADGCRELSKVCGNVPWALLSAGVAYEQFVDRVLTALDAGASGYIAGRAFWGEAVNLRAEDRRRFLRDTAVRRMTDLNVAIDGRGRPWHEVVAR
jgi:tagatose 1,6-diphosphate aldolase/sulfofructosephosphate aldolase